jgi:hypothetical protein
MPVCSESFWNEVDFMTQYGKSILMVSVRAETCAKLSHVRITFGEFVQPPGLPKPNKFE